MGKNVRTTFLRKNGMGGVEETKQFELRTTIERNNLEGVFTGHFLSDLKWNFEFCEKKYHFLNHSCKKNVSKKFENME